MRQSSRSGSIQLGLAALHDAMNQSIRFCAAADGVRLACALSGEVEAWPPPANDSEGRGCRSATAAKPREPL